MLLLMEDDFISIGEVHTRLDEAGGNTNKLTTTITTLQDRMRCTSFSETPGRRHCHPSLEVAFLMG